MQNNKLTQEDLENFKMDRDHAIELIKHYACQYKGQKHYEQLGYSCGVSGNGTVNAIINSTKYLKGKFLMPDEINIDKLVDWFMCNKPFQVERHVLAFYLAHIVKKKINELYRLTKKNGITITTYRSRRIYEREVKKRENMGVKIIRC